MGRSLKQNFNVLPRTPGRFGGQEAGCRRRESNPHEGEPRGILSPLRLPFRHSGVGGGRDLSSALLPAPGGYS